MKVNDNMNDVKKDNNFEEPIQNKHDDFEFMKERIKERPINKKKLLRRTIITASMAVIFGLVACFTFLVLEPVFSNWLYPEEAPDIVNFPEEDEETLPEDMLQDEEEDLEEEDGIEDQITTIVEKVGLEVSDYASLYNKLYNVAKMANKSMVTVTGVTSEVDWFNDSYESKRQTSGLIVEENGKELLVLVEYQAIADAEKIQVIFCDNSEAEGEVKEIDLSTQLAIISIDLTLLAKSTLDNIFIAELGSSNAINLVGTPIIAVGSPAGYNNSVCYGMITSTGNPIELVDMNYRLVTTDIYGSQSTSGIIVNLNGQVIGIVNNAYNNADTLNLLSAVGISELKNTIEGLSNGIDRAYLGIYGTDVTTEAYNQLDVPMGAYVTGIEMDSPAMSSGIQSGDVIVRIQSTEISSFGDYSNSILNYEPGSSIEVTVMRKGQEEYQEMTINVTLGSLE